MNAIEHSSTMNTFLFLTIIACTIHTLTALSCWNHHDRTSKCASSNSQTKCASLEGPIEGGRIATMGCIPKELEHFCDSRMLSNATEVRLVRITGLRFIAGG